MKKITAPRWELTIIMVVLLITSTTAAQDRTVIVPLGGAIGDAEVADVVQGKTFSSKNGKGLIGTRPAAPVPQSGEINCSDSSGTVISCTGTGQDGEIQSGVAFPTPRFTINGNGTVTDNLTDLVWLQNADCFGLRTWAQALTDSNSLASGVCDLTDGSLAGAWRLPNVKEFFSLIDFGYSDPSLANTSGTAQWSEGDAFLSVQNNNYWTSTSYSLNLVVAMGQSVGSGSVNGQMKSNIFHVWPVRD
jgi:hypothetical protein